MPRDLNSKKPLNGGHLTLKTMPNEPITELICKSLSNSKNLNKRRQQWLLQVRIFVWKKKKDVQSRLAMQLLLPKSGAIRLRKKKVSAAAVQPSIPQIDTPSINRCRRAVSFFFRRKLKTPTSRHPSDKRIVCLSQSIGANIYKKYMKIQKMTTRHPVNCEIIEHLIRWILFFF